MNPESLGAAHATVADTPARRLAAIVTFLFILSGATSLVYQVTWTRMLSLFFGSDVYAAAITLSVFMGGLSLGSWIAGRWGDRLGRPLLVYGWCEIAIAVCAYMFPVLLTGFEGVYQEVYRAKFEVLPGLYHGLRLVIAAAVLMIPTVLMGATLPLIVRQFAVSSGILGRRVGWYYATNTLGALLGTLAAGFILLPLIGVGRTMLAAILVNLAIGLMAVALGMRNAIEPADAMPPTVRETAKPGNPAEFQGNRVLLAMALSGFAALALEVVWMRVLVQSFSATVYAFSIMLACFLFGIFYGSRKASEIVDGHGNPWRLLVILELWVGGAVTVLAVLVYVVPGFFGNLLWSLVRISGGAFGWASVVAQFVVASLLIVGPTVMLGATFPVAVKIRTEDVSRRARGTGDVYAANTCGAVIGALVAGFVLLPTLGTRFSLLAIATVFFAAGAILATARHEPGLRVFRRPGPAAALALAVAAGIGAVLLPPQTVVNFNMQRSTTPEVLYHGEGVAHSVDIVRSDKGQTIMMINGNIEADTTLLQRRHFILKGHLPLLLHHEPRDVLVVGLGLGITLGATARHPTVKTIRLVEISPEMVAAHTRISDVTGNILGNPKVRLRIDDGRNFMAMTDERFDMITADPVHPRITGVGYLYTREYYQQIRRRLRLGGVVAQWMPMYHISAESFDVAFRTFVETFPHVLFWYVRGHGLFVASFDEDAIDFRTLAARFADPAVSEDFASIGIATPEAFLGHLLMDASHIAKYLAQAGNRRINTDDNAYLEYRTPFEFTGGTEAIVSRLLPFAGWDVDGRIKNAPDGVKAEIRRQVAARLGRIRPELAEPID